VPVLKERDVVPNGATLPGGDLPVPHSTIEEKKQTARSLAACVTDDKLL
jgi:hypothetical protein